ncbi:MAG: hydrogenase maturation nickel metallochaperone HypA [Leptolyngbya sp. LCM1.Bin17]|nr:MAG: hydrogenase maturation nickel metallochaperone HypA [Leptolyngbya sp. LCM1.Bin17]
MHELAITQTIIDTVAQQANGVPVRRVVLEIGQLAAILPDSIQFCFDVCARDTPLEGATLDIIEIPGRGRCRHCGHEMSLEMPYGICDLCDSLAIDIIAGQDLVIKTMETVLCV